MKKVDKIFEIATVTSYTHEVWPLLSAFPTRIPVPTPVTLYPQGPS